MGAPVGSAVGTAVGVRVGGTVGAADGRTVGTVVGENDGAGDGAKVGGSEIVGAGVGWRAIEQASRQKRNCSDASPPSKGVEMMSEPSARCSSTS